MKRKFSTNDICKHPVEHQVWKLKLMQIGKTFSY